MLTQSILPSIQWQRTSPDRLFSGVSVDGTRLPRFGTRGLMDASVWREADPNARINLSSAQAEMVARDLEAKLEHEEAPTTIPGSLLKTRLSIVNRSDEPLALVVGCHSGLRPSASTSLETLYFPLTALGTLPHPALAQLGANHQVESLRSGPGPAEKIAAHYLEPLGSDPQTLTTHAPLLIPLVTQLNPHALVGISFFASPEIPWGFFRNGTEQGESWWTIQTRVQLAPQEHRELEVFVAIHSPAPESAWPLFHELCAPAGPEIPEWVCRTKVHYFDFFSATSPEVARGGGYLADAVHFKAFGVGLATQHGYYPHWGDYIQPDRRTWRAMPADIHGGSEISIEGLRQRIALTREAGSRAAIYLHLVGFDDASPLAKKLLSGCRIESDGQSPPFEWRGPDVVGTSRFMSIANEQWREHLLQQAQWIFELLDPDAIVVDESFAGIGYDYGTGSAELTSPSSIRFFRALRDIARSFGSDKAILTADCALSAFVLWADGEAGDHCYAQLLGHEAYRRDPVRYLAALGSRPWVPCAWLWQQFWNEQLDLAQKTGAGIGLANGWLDYAGLAGLSANARQSYLADLARISAR